MEGIDAIKKRQWETTYSEGDDARDSESLSDIDDAEVCSYLNNEKEMNYRKIIWEKLNWEYLQEQEAKKSAAAKPKREHKQKQPSGVKKTQSTTETADATSSKKRCSSRINYDALSKILDESLPSDSPKRRRMLSDSDRNSDIFTQPQLADDELITEDENEEDDWEEPDDYSYYNNQEEEYNNFDDDEFF